MKKEFPSVHNEDVRRFAEGAQPTITTPTIAYGRAFAGAGAAIVLLILIILAIPALRGAGDAPPPLADVRAALPTAAVVAPAAPVAPAEVPIVPPTAPAAPAAPTAAAAAYRQLPPEALAAGWTPEARDLQIAGGSWYTVLPERVGASCRIRVVTGSEPSGLTLVADVWAACGQVEGQP
ncbi:hypothetical protein EKD04_017800 [Chloroflexales bacterium ZM16-3]|nr:hypothetical protein [Chloroflexales bacterium ZM16-3]